MIRSLVTSQFFIFLISGGIAACINFLSRILFSQWLDFSASIILAYLCGMVTAFILAKLFVFKESDQSLGRSIFFFCIVNLVAVLQTWVISMLFFYCVLPSLRIVDFTHEISHAIGIVIPVFTSYLGHRYFSFREKGV